MAIALVLVAGELGEWAAGVRESDEGGGESWVGIGGVWVLEALGLKTEHRNTNYTLRGGGGGWGTVILAERA